MEINRPTILIAGVGNVLHGDDGFGIEVANRLQAMDDLPACVKVMETGIGGMSLIQELLYGYDALIILDAYENNGKPGDLYLLEPIVSDMSELSMHELRDYFSDTHYATPMRVLNLLGQMQKLPETIFIVGCEPEELDDLRIGLSKVVSNAIDKALLMVRNCVADQLRLKHADLFPSH